METQEAPGSRRPPAARCALPLAVCALLISLAVLAVILASQQQQKTQTQLPFRSTAEPQEPLPQLWSTAEPLEPQYRAQLPLSGSKVIENKTLEWAANTAIQGVSLGQEFEYENPHHLRIKVSDQYYIYAQMTAKLKVESSKENGSVTLTIHLSRTGVSSESVLHLTLHLTPHVNQLSAFTAVLSYPLKKGDLLSVDLTCSSAFKEWQLDNAGGNIFGLCRNFTPDENRKHSCSPVALNVN